MTKKSTKRGLMADRARIIGAKGSASLIAEAFLALANVPYFFENIDDETIEAKTKLSKLNPLNAVPTVVLTDGTILTETLAIGAYADEMDPELRLIPSKGGSDYTPFWQWISFIAATIDPSYKVGDGAAEIRKKMWKWVEQQARTPYFLGSGFSAIDIYLAVMRHWDPGLDWFEKECPKIAAIGNAIESEPHLEELFAQNFTE